MHSWLQFPFAAKYPPQGMEPPIITSCINYHPQPCDSSAQIQLGDITFDTTLPTLIITKVAEQFGNPTTTTLRKLQTVQPLFALMLFNFSKSSERPYPSSCEHAMLHYPRLVLHSCIPA